MDSHVFRDLKKQEKKEIYDSPRTGMEPALKPSECFFSIGKLLWILIIQYPKMCGITIGPTNLLYNFNRRVPGSVFCWVDPFFGGSLSWILGDGWLVSLLVKNPSFIWGRYFGTTFEKCFRNFLKHQSKVQLLTLGVA